VGVTEGHFCLGYRVGPKEKPDVEVGIDAASTIAPLRVFAALGILPYRRRTMRVVSDLQYMNREDPMPGDRITDREGRVGTVTEVRTGNRAIFDGELAVKWDDGLAACNYPLAENFALLSRACSSDHKG
jgi:hypothetical protein